MNKNSNMLLTYSLENLFKALQILLPKMKRKEIFKINKAIFSFQTQGFEYTPIITLTKSTNSFSKNINGVII